MNSCRYCPEKAVYYRRISGEYLCKTHFLKSIEDRIRKSVRKYQMFGPQEKVVVSFSGGKDSLVLLYNVLQLQRRSDRSPPVEAILIDEGIAGYRQESLAYAIQVCKEWHVPLHILSFQQEFGAQLDNLIPRLEAMQMNPCTVCGTVRRRLLNQKAVELKADRLAIGHNLDDVAETFLQNILRNDLQKVHTNPPYGNPIDPEGDFVPRVKPLLTLLEEEIVRYCFYRGFPIQRTPCPYSTSFYILRRKVQEFLNAVEAESAEVKYNLLEMNLKLINHPCLQNTADFIESGDIVQEEGPQISKSTSFSHTSPATHTLIPAISPNRCAICDSPCGASRTECYYCELRKKLGLEIQFSK